MEEVFTQAKTIYDLIDFSIKISFVASILSAIACATAIYYLSKTWNDNPWGQIILLILVPIITFGLLANILVSPVLNPNCPDVATETTIGCIDVNDLANLKDDENYQDETSQIILIKTENLIAAPMLINSIPKNVLYATLFFAVCFPFAILASSRFSIKP
jgi:hypothetical protein